MPQPPKIYYLDGIRGIAAFIVVVHHFGLAFIPSYFDWDLNHLHWAGYEVAYGKSIFSICTNGNFAVCIFFVLSGFVLSRQYLLRNETSVLVSTAIRRFTRLYIPVAATLIIAYLLLKAGWYSNQALSKVSGSWWIENFWITADPQRQLADSLFFQTMLTGEAFWDTSLWTINKEFYGSMLVFAFLALTHQARNKCFWLACVFIYFVCLKQPYYASFVLGISLHFLKPWHMRPGVVRSLLTVLLLALGIVLGSYPTNDIPKETIFYFLPANGIGMVWFHIVGSFFIIISVLLSPRLQHFFSLWLFRFLGRISFSLYLLHALVLGSFSSYVFLHLYQRIGYMHAAGITLLATIAVCFTASYLMTRFVDENGIRFSKYFFNRFFKQLAAPVE